MSRILDSRFLAPNSITGADLRLDNDQYLKARNAADNADVNVIKVDAFDRTILNAASGQSILFEKSFLPALDNTYSSGLVTVSWSDVASRKFSLAEGASVGEINPNATSPSGATNSVSFLTTGTKDLSIFTANSAVADAAATKPIRIETGNKSAGTGATGAAYLVTGNSVGGNSGGLTLKTGTAATTRGDIDIDGRLINLRPSASVQSYGAIVPDAPNTRNLGAGGLSWNLIYGNFFFGQGALTYYGSNFNTAGAITVQTGDSNTAANTADATVQSGDQINVGSGTVGDLILKSGSVIEPTNNNNSGDVSISTGTTAGSGIRGNIVLNGNTLDVLNAPLGNNLALRGKNTTGTALNLIKVNAVDRIEVGNGNNMVLNAANVLPNVTGSNMGAAGNLWDIYVNSVQTPLIWEANNASVRTQDNTVTNPISVLTGASSAGDSGDITIRSGIATGGDSGDILLQVGSATGTQGVIRLVDGSLGAASVGYVWTLNNITTGEGNWAAAGGGGGATTALDNLAATAVNADISPLNTAANIDLGSPTKRWAEVHVSTLYVRDIFQATLGSTPLDIQTVASTQTGNIDLQSGNSSAGTSGAVILNSGSAVGGNSGGIQLLVGTSTATQGEIAFLKNGDTTTIGHVWTATGTAGEGYWAAAAAGGANTALSNLTATAINLDLDPASGNATDLGNTTNYWRNGFINRIDLVNGGTAWHRIRATTSGMPSGGSSDLAFIGLSKSLGFWTNNESAASTNSPGVFIETGNAAGVTSNSGDISIQTGTATQTRGSIVLNANSLDLTNAPIGSNILPDANATRNLGATGTRFNFMFGTAAFVGSGAGNGHRMVGSETLPSGATTVAGHRSEAAQHLGLYTIDQAATKNVYVESGNASGGNSGDIALQTGTATGTRGSIVLNANSLDLTNAPIGSNILPNVTNTYDLGSSSSLFWKVLYANDVRSPQIRVTDATDSPANHLELTAIPQTGPNSVSYATSMRTIRSEDNLGIYTRNNTQTTKDIFLGSGDQTNATGANLSGDVKISTGDNSSSDAGAPSGDILLETGSVNGGTQGDIIFKDGSEGTAGHVWTSTGTLGEGNWAVPSVSFPLAAPSGSAGTPSYNFSTATNAGMFINGSSLAFSHSGTNRLEINGNTVRPGTTGVVSLGQNTRRFANMYSSLYTMINSSNTETGTVIETTVPSGATLVNVLRGVIAPVGIMTTNSGVASATTGAAYIETGNSTGTTANSGNINIQTGTATQTRGKISFKDGTETGAGAGAVWTQAAADGIGGWAAPAGGANLSLSNLTSPTAINQSLLMTTGNTLRIPNNEYLTWRNSGNTADISPIRVNAGNEIELVGRINPTTNATQDFGAGSNRFRRFYASAQIRVGGDSTLGGELTASTLNPSSVSAFGIFTVEDGKAIGVWTANNATADAAATGDTLIDTGNKTAGTGASGKIKLQTGTSVGGARGNIELDALTIDYKRSASKDKIWENGATGSRPGTPLTGHEYFDTTLGQPIWYDGTNWVDAQGVTV